MPKIALFAWVAACGASAPETAPTPPVAASPREPAVAPEVPAAPPPMIAIDTHCDTPQRMLDEGDDLSQRLPNGHVDLPRMREGGLTAVFMSIWVDPRRYEGDA